MEIVELFKELIAFDTMSDEYSSTYPSSSSQIEFGKLLVKKIKDLNVKEVYQDEYGLVYVFIDNHKKKTIGLISHMDTSPSLKGGIKNPRIINNYQGNDIKLNDQYSLQVKDFPFLNDLKNEDLMVTDGEHLLGGDDKAGIAIILVFLEYYINHLDEFNYNLSICFTPDEEIGEGALHFDVHKMKADVAYTLDGESIYEANYENFNAAHAIVTIYGVGVHPGMAKNIMVNAASIGCEFQSLLPIDEVPEKTSDREGFIHLNEMKGDCEKCQLFYILRDHDKNLLEEKKKIFIEIKKKLDEKYPKSKIILEIKDDYKNMFDYFKNDMSAIDLINRAYLKKSVKISYTPIRGGTDGATITYLGLPCPNLGVGDFSPHGRFELVSITQMKLMVEILKELFK